MATGKLERTCYVCGGHVSWRGDNFLDCDKCGLVYANSRRGLPCKRPLLDHVNDLRHKLVRTLEDVRHVLNLLIDPEEAPDVRRKRRQRKA